MPGELREAEIEDLHPGARVQHDVARLDIAVMDAAAMGIMEAFGDLTTSAYKLRGGEGGAKQHLLQRFALNQLHGDEGRALCNIHLVDGRDVGVVEARGCLRFLKKATTCLRIGCHVRRQEFESGIAAQGKVFRTVHSTHAAFAELGKNAIVRDGLPDQICCVRRERLW